MQEKIISRGKTSVYSLPDLRTHGLKKDFGLSIKIVWIILSVLILGIVSLTFFFPDTLLKLSPVCFSKSLYGEECFMCGMTRAFVEITNGNFYNAGLLNGFSIYLLSIFILNEIIFFCYISGKFIKGFNSKKQFQFPINLKN